MIKNNKIMKIRFNILILLSLCISVSTLNAAESENDTIRAQGGTGYKINNLRIFTVDQNTVYKEDGEIIPETRAQGGTGYKIRYKATEVNPNITQGTLAEVDLINIYKGPVVSVSPFRLFNIDNLIGNQTHFANGLNLEDIQLGDMVSASGFIDNGSVAIMTRIEATENLEQWKLSGYVDDMSSNQFRINDQVVIFSASVISDCLHPLNEGDFVEVNADAINDFMLGDDLNTVTSIKCVDESIIPDNTSDKLILEGMIDAIDGGGFILSGQNITVTNSTRFIRGRADDIQERIKIEVEGTSNPELTAIIASKIRFLEPRINLTLPVRPQDLSAGQFNVAGVSVLITPQVIDPDEVLINGLDEEKQLQFKGYDYGDDNLYLTRIQQRGQVDYNDVSLSGSVTAINEPTIKVFGVLVDTTGAVFMDLDNHPISSSEFYQLAVIGAELKIENAALSGVNNSISGGVISLVEMPNDEFELSAAVPPSQTVFGVGTVTSLTDAIFDATFD